MRKKNYIFDKEVSEQLNEIVKFYGMNETAVINMLITDRYVELMKKEKQKEIKNWPNKIC